MIIVNLDVMMAKRKVPLGDLAERVGITPANLSILKTGKARAVRFSTLNAICRELDCQPGDVLEYVKNREEILNQLVRVLKPQGILSVIKHNLCGRVMGSAVLGNDPQAALDLLNDVKEDSMFGDRSVYSNEWLVETLSENMKLTDTYGIRAFFGLSSNNEIKYTDEWYEPMLELESKASSMEEFKKIAFFNHLIFKAV